MAASACDSKGLSEKVWNELRAGRSLRSILLPAPSRRGNGVGRAEPSISVPVQRRPGWDWGQSRLSDRSPICDKMLLN